MPKITTIEERLSRMCVPMKEVEVSNKHYYWVKKDQKFVVKKIIQRHNRITTLHYLTTPCEEIAKQASIDMCNDINDYMRRKHGQN